MRYWNRVQGITAVKQRESERETDKTRLQYARTYFVGNNAEIHFVGSREMM